MDSFTQTNEPDPEPSQTAEVGEFSGRIMHSGQAEGINKLSLHQRGVGAKFRSAVVITVALLVFLIAQLTSGPSCTSLDVESFLEISHQYPRRL